MGLADKVLTGNLPAAARLISGLEAENPDALAELDILYPHTGKAQIIGITGAPGIGKSTLISSLTTIFRQRRLTVGIVAIDPSSPFTGGAIMGDRIRMRQHTSDKGVFVRSLATRGYAGGIAKVTLATIHVMDAMGKDIIMIETVGTGQNEIDIASIADTTLVMLSAESGDDVQMMKAGIMEIADIFVINKADKEGASQIATEVESMLGMKSYSANEWQPPVVLTEAIFDKGIDILADAIIRHHDYLVSSGELANRRMAAARHELESNMVSQIKNYLSQGITEGDFNRLVADLARRKINPNLASRRIIETFFQHFKP